jgi:Icc-related predicted phosphoesterase
VFRVTASHITRPGTIKARQVELACAPKPVALKPMKILTVSDVVEPQLYHTSLSERYSDVDLVMACGDLPNYYLEFIVTVLNKPLYFVFGNHDQQVIQTDRGPRPVEPGGCVNLDGRTINHNGLLLAGLEGSMRYKLDGGPQYTDGEMWLKIWSLVPKLLWNRLRYGRYLDVLITHAPPYGVHDASDLCHTGFKGFLWLMRHFRPRYLIHGHIHLYGYQSARRTIYQSTLVVNAYGHQIVEWQRI